MHEEKFELGEETTRTVNEARQAGRALSRLAPLRCVSGSVAAQNHGRLVSAAGRPHFIYPPYGFKSWMRCSLIFTCPFTLLMLVAGFGARGNTGPS